MNETILFPSPNWFQSSGFVATSDDWIIFGGTSKSLCVLEPLAGKSPRLLSGNEGHHAHVVKAAHPQKIVCIDVCPEWPSKRAILTGSSDGLVKQWSFEHVNQLLQIKSTQSHDSHKIEKEEVAGVGYCNNGYAITVGCLGHIAKWDLNSNVLKTYHNVLKNFKPVCIACSPHLHLNVAVGTKQGVVFVLDLNGAARVVYKVRCQDDEIVKLGWCPKYEVTVKKTLTESQRKSTATEKLKKIRNEPVDEKLSKELDERVKQSLSVPHFTEDKSAIIPDVTEERAVVINPDLTEEKPQVSLPKVTDEKTDVQSPKPKDEFNESGIGKTLPEDSFEDTIVDDDDIFDIYKDHEADEFGHKKYQPEDIIVKIKQEKPEVDYLTECMKLKEDILRKKNEPGPSIEALVDALDKTHVGESVAKDAPNDAPKDEPESNVAKKGIKYKVEASVHIHKHLLATVGRHGSVRVWSKAGKLVGSCSIHGASGGSKHQRGNKTTSSGTTTLLWCKPNLLLLADAKNQLLECNPLKIDSKNKLDWRVVHSEHKRPVFAIASNAPRVQLPVLNLDDESADSAVEQSDDQLADLTVWTTSQDRNIVKYSMRDRKLLSIYNSCGGFIYYVVPCPYDAKKVAVCVGDGTVRVVDLDTSDDDEGLLTLGKVDSFWHGVQGKVLTAAWHPSREYLLAFGTGESRVALLDTSNPDKPAKVLLPVLTNGVYYLSWGEGNSLFACGGGQLVEYDASKPENAPTPVPLELDGQLCPVSAVQYHERGLVMGTSTGCVAVMDHATPRRLLAAVYAYSKMIHTVDWHPQQTSNSTEESPHKNLIAVCSVEKSNNIVILEFGDKEDGDKQLLVWKTLSGHKGVVFQLKWNPHVEGQLLSTSQDTTVRVWDAVTGTCTGVFGAHGQLSLGGAWLPDPRHASRALSGGADCCLRLWDVTHHQENHYQELKHEVKDKKDKKKKDKKEDKEQEQTVTEGQKAAISDIKPKSSKRFLMPLVYRQMNPCKVNGIRRMAKKYLESSGDYPGDIIADTTDESDLDYLKLFGTTNDVNDILATEMERHEDTGHVDPWMMLQLFRGHIDTLVQLASRKDLLDAYLVSITPCVSIKYWKETTQLYLAQIDRLVAKGDEAKLSESRTYGGPVYRKAGTLLSIHDITGAVAHLTEARFFKEAYLLCRTRYIDSLAEETLQKWAEDSNRTGQYHTAAICYIALGNLSQATNVLGKSSDEEALYLAADLAKITGKSIFADHIEKKREQILTNKDQSQEKNEPGDLPTRVDLMVDNKENDSKENGHINETEKMLGELPAKLEQLLKENEGKEESVVDNTEVDN